MLKHFIPPKSSFSSLWFSKKLKCFHGALKVFVSHRHCVGCGSGISQPAWEHSLPPRMALQVCSSPSSPGSPKCIGSASKHQSELLGGADAPLPLQMKILKLKEAKVKLSKMEGPGFELGSVWPQSPWFDSHFPLCVSGAPEHYSLDQRSSCLGPTSETSIYLSIW